ncbi:MAG TPA: zinc-binding alcohol dehydrogenase [Firmicutes bacterium]|nr:zinc-binding alcohol dehydrogenase [Bacillota bacterium]
MPLELIAVQPRTAEFRTYSDDFELQENQVQIKALYGSPKHGTELNMYRGTNPFQEKTYDSHWQIFRETDAHTSPFPMGLGNMFVGAVTALGSQVADIRVGDRVAGYGNLRETHTVRADDVWKMPEGMAWQAALCFDPAQYALQGLRDSMIRFGDTTAVFGLGAIGLLAVAMAKLGGAHLVVGVDPIAKRRETALELGADIVLDPKAVDVGLEIKKATNRRGVDCVIETSGTAHALHQAIRGTAFGGRVSMVGWYNQGLAGLNFGEEAHFNIPELVFSRAASEPSRDYPRWTRDRIKQVCWDVLASGKIPCEKIIDPVVSFCEADSAYAYYVDQHPEESIKLGVVFPSSTSEGRND